MSSDNRKHAVILSGGGANGAYEVGVLRALFEGNCPATQGAPIEPFLYCGTSVGSYNAAAAVSLADQPGVNIPDRLEGLWLDRISESPDGCGNGVYRMRGDPRRIFDPRCLFANPTIPAGRAVEDLGQFGREMFMRGTNLLFSGEPFDRRAMEMMNLESLVSVRPLRDLISETINLERIRNSTKQLRIAATNWETGALKIFDNSEMSDESGHSAVMASCAIPVFFPPVAVNGSIYVDGGVVLNTPLEPAIAAGADVIHCIYLDPTAENIPFAGLQNSMDTLCRMVVIMMAQHLNRDIDTVSAYNRILDGSVLDSETAPDFFLRKVAQLLNSHSVRGRGTEKLTVHCYRPREVLSALVGILKFGRGRLSELIDRGYDETRNHDCAANGCVLI